jgi:hypothetical protein
MDADEVRPDKQRGRLIEFERADVITPMIEPPQPNLLVSGVLPHPEMTVTLVPLAYVSQPQYQGIQVVGTLNLGGGPHPTQPIANVPYSVQLRLEGITGAEGVEVIGANGTERIAVPTGTAQA